MQLNQQTPTIVRPLIPGITHQLIINGTFHFARLDIFTSHDGVSFELLDISPIDKPGTYPLTHPTHTTYKIALRSATPQTSIDLTIPTSLEPVSITYLDHAPGNEDALETIEVTANFGLGEETVVLTGGHLGPQDYLTGEWVSAPGSSPYVIMELAGDEVSIRSEYQGIGSGVDTTYSVNEQVLPWLADWASAVLTGGASGVPVVTLVNSASIKTTGTFAIYDGQLYANHGSDEAPDFHPIIKSGIKRIVSITQAAYDLLSPPDAETLYLITE